MKDHSIPALMGRDNVVPPRLVIVPDLASFFTDSATWLPQTVETIMAWSDIRQAAGRWQGVAIAAPTLSFFQMERSSDFNQSWREWTEQAGETRRIRVVVQDAMSDRYVVFGPNGAELIAEVTIFDREFFGNGRGPAQDSVGQQLNFWSRFFDTAIPDSETVLSPGKSIEEWINDGDVSLSCKRPNLRTYQQVVVLRGNPNPNEQETATCFPLKAAYNLPTAC